MTDHVLWPLAQSLATQDWTVAALKAHLAQRLPRALVRSIAPAAKHLVAELPGSTTPDAATILAVLREMALADRLHAHVAQNGGTFALRLDPIPFRPTEALASLPLPRLGTEAELAFWLGLTPELLTRLADLRGLSAQSRDPFGPHYLLHRIAKSGGGFRLIEAPRPLLKKVQRRILEGILALVPPHPAAHGFVRGRGAVQAAARHCGEEVVTGFDIRDFFPSIPFTRVYAIFRTLGYPRSVALPLTGLCTAWPQRQPGLPDGFRNRHLPQGAPTSPALANLAAFRLDARLAGLARSLDLTYTRYADDLTFSGGAARAGVLLKAVPAILAVEGFRPHPGKTRQTPAHRAQTVTGIRVNAHVNLPRKDYDQIKAVLHHLAKGDPRRHDPAFMTHLSGRISWAEQLNPARARRLRAAFDAL